MKLPLTSGDAYTIKIYSFSNGSYSASQPHIEFPAFITDFNDSFKSEWKKETIYGKMDPISTFKNTSRTITISFDIPNASINNAAENMKYIDYLIRGLYPIYSDESGGTAVMVSPPMFRVKFSNLVSNAKAIENDDNTLKSGLLCYIQGFDFKPKIDSGFFIDENNVLFPKLLSVSMTMDIIHEHSLGNKKENGKLAPRININSFPHKFPETPKISQILDLEALNAKAAELAAAIEAENKEEKKESVEDSPEEAETDTDAAAGEANEAEVLDEEDE